MKDKAEKKGFPAYGSWPVVVFWIAKSELREFSMDITSFVDATTPGTAIAMSTTYQRCDIEEEYLYVPPAQTSLSLFAPSVRAELPPVIV